jgi:hypothetical protein
VHCGVNAALQSLLFFTRFGWWRGELWSVPGRTTSHPGSFQNQKRGRMPCGVWWLALETWPALRPSPTPAPLKSDKFTIIAGYSSCLLFFSQHCLHFVLYCVNYLRFNQRYIQGCPKKTSTSCLTNRNFVFFVQPLSNFFCLNFEQDFWG